MITFSNKFSYFRLLTTSVLLTVVVPAYASENIAGGGTEIIAPAEITTQPLPEVSLDLPVIPLADAVTSVAVREGTLRILGENVLPGTSERLSWSATELFEGVPVSTPVLVVNGAKPGPTLCLAAAVHGDELNGIEIVRRVIHDLDEQNLNGAVIGIPIVNVQGFRRGSRYLPDRRDLNRYFPGNPNGSAAARIAHSFFTQVIPHCDALIDVHTGSLSRSNLPQIRADLRNPEVVTLTQGFASMVVLHSPATPGMLRYAATEAGVPTVTLEAGGPLVLELNEVKRGVKGVESLLTSLGMVPKLRLFGDPEPVYYSSSWVRSNNGGILLSNVSLGSTIRKGDLLGTITDPMNNVQIDLLSPYSGRVIGMSRNQVVMPGDAAFHVGIQAEDASTVEPTEPFEGEDPEEGVADESRLSE
jgi:predicted deacylase